MPGSLPNPDHIVDADKKVQPAPAPLPEEVEDAIKELRTLAGTDPGDGLAAVTCGDIIRAHISDLTRRLAEAELEACEAAAAAHCYKGEYELLVQRFKDEQAVTVAQAKRLAEVESGVGVVQYRRLEAQLREVEARVRELEAENVKLHEEVSRRAKAICRAKMAEAEWDAMREQVEELRDSLQHYKHLYDVLTYSREGGR